MTISYGGCEQGASSDVTFYNALFSTAAAEGISTFVSSGDSEATGCATAGDAPKTSTQVLSINALCSSSYVTCVGGTEFNDTASPSSYWSSSNGTGLSSALSYIPEGAWNEPYSTSAHAYEVLGTGGGPSLYIAKPSWQTGTGVPADGARDTPDIAFPSAGHDGYYSCLDGTCGTGTSPSSSFIVFAGTSAASPGMAGIMALVVQKTGHAQGNFNPTLYRLAASTSNIFHDATPATSGVSSCSLATASMCNNSTPGVSALTGGLAGYALTTGYDLATGLGSLDVANLLSGVSAGFTITSGSAFALNAGSSGSSTIAVNSVNGFAGTVVLTCAITAVPTTAANVTPTCILSPASTSLTSGASSSSLVTISTTLRSAAAAAPATAGYAHFGILVCLFIFAVPLALQKRFPDVLIALLLAVGLCALAGCGAGGSPAVQAANGTSAGQYTATITGTSGSLTATGTVVFTVN